MLFHHPILDPLINLAEEKVDVFFDQGKCLPAADLWRNAKALATELERHGFKKDDGVVLAFPGGSEFLTVMFACILLRVKVSIIDPEMGRELYAEKLKQFNPKWAFVDSRLLLLQEHPVARFIYFRLCRKTIYFPRHKGTRVIAMGKYYPLFQQLTWFKKFNLKTDPVSIRKIHADHDFLIVYTSGTLQEPKGVMLSLDALVESIGQLVRVLNCRREEKIGTHLPHFILLGIAASIPVYFFDPGKNPQEKLNFLSENKITIVFGPPSEFLPLVKFCEQNAQKLPSTLSHILLGSAPVHATFIDRLYSVSNDSLKITCTYGMTENLLVCVIDGKEKIKYDGEGDPVGKPVPGVDVRIMNDGEITLKSKQLYSRYFHQQDRTDFHFSGDLGFLDKEGNLFLKGRKKEMIIRGNTNIYPALYEPTIKRINGVDEAAMVGIYNEEKQDEEVILVIEGNGDLTAKEILQKLTYGVFQIDKEAMPDRIVFMKIPRKGRQNKIDRGEITRLLK
jgi:long-chain acyl-CoA synthetase